MSQFPLNTEDNDAQAPLPDVPPEYLSSEPPDDTHQDAWQPEVSSVEPAAAAEVPAEYLSTGAEIYPAASERHPEPTTDVPAEYLGEAASTLRTDSLPPAQSSYMGGSSYPPAGAPVYPAAQAAQQPKDRSIAILLEVLPGLFGFMGLGWIYAGNIAVGLALLVGYLVFIGFEILLAIPTIGLICCCTLPINFAALAASALLLNNYAEQHPELFSK